MEGRGPNTDSELVTPPRSGVHGSPTWGHASSKLVVVTRAVADGTSPRWIAYLEEDEGFLIGETYVDPVEQRWQDLVVVCLDCLLERHPAVGRGMDFAKETGESALVDGEWLEQPR